MIDFARLAEPHPERSVFAALAPTLHHLAMYDVGYRVPLTQLRRAHLELQAQDVAPTTQTLTAWEAVEAILEAPRTDVTCVLAFTLDEDRTRFARQATLLPSQHAVMDLDRESVTRLFGLASPGDRVVLIGVHVRRFAEPVAASGLYRIITLS